MLCLGGSQEYVTYMCEQPYAGFDILFSGDMFQIPPVAGSAVYYDTEGTESKEVKQAPSSAYDDAACVWRGVGSKPKIESVLEWCSQHEQGMRAPWMCPSDLPIVDSVGFGHSTELP